MDYCAAGGKNEQALYPIVCNNLENVSLDEKKSDLYGVTLCVKWEIVRSSIGLPGAGVVTLLKQQACRKLSLSSLTVMVKESKTTGNTSSPVHRPPQRRGVLAEGQWSSMESPHFERALNRRLQQFYEL